MTNDASNVREYFTNKQWAFFIFILILSLVFRFVCLEDRPIHHDESIHLIQGYYYYERPDTGYYKYDPMTHGPFLYHALRYMYRLLGYSVFAGRSFIAIIGSIFVLMPFFFRKYLKPTTVLFMTMLIGLSPTMIYWSRFVRSDYLMLSWWIMILVGVVLANDKWKPILVTLGIALQLCTKENSYVFYVMMLGYLFFELAFSFITKDDIKETLIYKAYKSVVCNKFRYVVGLAISFFVIYYFFSGGFRYFIEGKGFFEHWFGTFLDGTYRKSIEYWMRHHGMERIKGPFLFQFYMMAWHDFLLVLLLLAHIIYLLIKSVWTRFAFAIALLVAIILHVMNCMYAQPGVNSLEGTAIWNFFKLKNSYDFYGLCILPVYAVVVTVYHLLNKEKMLAFFGYFAAGNMATYCYLGEKVPWLSVYPILAFMVYYGLLFDKVISCETVMEKLKNFKLDVMMGIVGAVSIVLGIIFIIQSKTPETNKFIFHDNVDFIIFGVVVGVLCTSFKNVKFNFVKFVFVAFFLYDLRVARIVNFQNAGNEFEVFSQVHTSKELHDILHGIIRTIDDYSLGYMPLMYVKGETNWPTVTYMIGHQQLKYSMDGYNFEDFKYIIEDQESTRQEKKEESIIKGREDQYFQNLIKTRCWWDPDFNKMTLKAFLNYAFNHIPWSGPGFYHAMLYVRRE